MGSGTAQRKNNKKRERYNNNVIVFPLNFSNLIMFFCCFAVPPLGVKIISDDQPLVAGKEYLLGRLKGQPNESQK